MISFVSEEWGYSCSSTQSIIVSELCKREKFGPIVLLIVAVYAEVLFQCLVGAFRSEEWGYSCSSTQSIIVSELCKREKFGPIVLLIVAVYAEVLFQCLVGAFSLSVAFWVISRGEVKLHVESFAERSKEVQDELRSAVGCYV